MAPVFFWKAEDPELGFLCQWYSSTFETDLEKDGKKLAFRNAEQYMMYRKAMHFNDIPTANEILKAGSNPRKCKALGRSTKNFNPTEWDAVKSQVVEEGSYLKFTRSLGPRGEELKKQLLDTGDRLLVEASRFDRVWGVGFDREKLLQMERDRVGRDSWGENRLGKALMVARERIRGEEVERERERMERRRAMEEDIARRIANIPARAKQGEPANQGGPAKQDDWPALGG